MKIPWTKIKDLALELSGDLWLSEEAEIRRIIDKLPAEEKQVTVSFQHTINCSGETPSIKTKISFSEKFSATASGSVDDPAQMTLEEAGKKSD